MATLTLKRGDTFDRIATYKDSLSVPIDITGWSIKVQARSAADNIHALFSLSIGSGVTITDPVNGEFKMYISETKTSGYATGTYVVDIEFTDNSGIVISTETFNIEIVKDVSR